MGRWKNKKEKGDLERNRYELAVLEPDRAYVKTVWGIGFKMESL